MVKHYKNSAGQLCAFESDGSQDSYITPDMQGPLTDEQVAALRAPPFAEHKAMVMAKFRADRVDMLDVLTGIAGRAERAGQSTTAISADAVAEALLALPAVPAVVNATDAEGLKTAMRNAYDAAIVGAHSSVLIAWQKVMKQ